MDLPDAIDYDRTGDSPIKPEPVPDSDDRARRRQPAGVRVIACIWGLAGAVLLALATVLAGTVATIPSGEYLGGAVPPSEELGRLHSAVLSAGEYLGGAVPPSEVLGWIHGAAPSIGGALISLKSAAIAVLYCLASLLIVDSCWLLAGKPWARKLAAGLAVLFILIGIVPLLCAIMRKISRRWGVKIPIEATVAGLLISAVGGIILLYLYSPHVRQYFGGERRQSQDGLRGTRL